MECARCEQKGGQEMRVTKAMLVAELARAAQFNGFELVFVPAGAEEKTRALPGFKDVCQYGRGAFPLRNEIGTADGKRFILRERKVVRK